MTKFEYCIKCNEPTYNAGKGNGSLYLDDTGPYCDACYYGNLYEGYHRMKAENKIMKAENKIMKIAFIIIYTIFASALIVGIWDTVEDSAEYDRLSAVNDSIIERNWAEIKRNAATNDSLAAINDSLWLELEEEISHLVRRYNACAVSSANGEKGTK